MIRIAAVHPDVVADERLKLGAARFNAEWLELFNADGDPVDVYGYFVVNGRGEGFTIELPRRDALLVGPSRTTQPTRRYVTSRIKRRGFSSNAIRISGAPRKTTRTSTPRATRTWKIPTGTSTITIISDVPPRLSLNANPNEGDDVWTSAIWRPSGAASSRRNALSSSACSTGRCFYIGDGGMGPTSAR